MRATAILLIAVGVGRIVATYPVFSHTFDELAHIAAGMQLLDRGEFSYEPLHPPLSRIAVALGPYLAGYSSMGGSDMWIEGRRIFSRGYEQVLTLARVGVLPFFVLTLVVTWLWARRVYDDLTGALAAILLSGLPLLLAHSGLATTDVVFTAAFLLAFVAFIDWLERPGTMAGLMLGVALALCVTAKLSSLLFLPAGFLPIVLCRWYLERGRWTPLSWLRAWRNIAVGGTAFVAVIGLVYGFNDPVYGLERIGAGLRELTEFSSNPQPSYLLGTLHEGGRWLFFPVLLLVKTPIPFLIALPFGAYATLAERLDWQRLAPLLAAFGVFVAVLPSPVNFGLRHLLPIFPLLAIFAARGVAMLLTSRARLAPAAGAALLATHLGVGAAAHPDYLAYFNLMAGDSPEKIVVGSDLDWGQDIKRLAKVLKARRIDHVHIALHSSGEPRRRGLPPSELLAPGERANGWIAISEQVRAYYCAGYAWLDRYPIEERVGSSIRLYHVPPGAEVERDVPWTEVDWSMPQPCDRNARHGMPASLP